MIQEIQLQYHNHLKTHNLSRNNNHTDDTTHEDENDILEINFVNMNAFHQYSSDEEPLTRQGQVI